MACFHIQLVLQKTQEKIMQRFASQPPMRYRTVVCQARYIPMVESPFLKWHRWPDM